MHTTTTQPTHLSLLSHDELVNTTGGGGWASYLAGLAVAQTKDILDNWAAFKAEIVKHIND
jgi:hypothetical protein